MTKNNLEQLIDLKKEIEEINQNILRIEQMSILSADEKAFETVHGYDSVQSYQYLYEQKELLCERKMQVAKEEAKLMQYINGIQESRVRRIMQFRYINGYSWEKIGEIMHFDRRTGERIVSRYLKQQKSK